MLHSTMVFFSLPPKTFVGLDLISFTAASKFEGIQNLPPGIHFVFTGTDASLSIRHGHWFRIASKSQKVQAPLIFDWNHEDEALVRVQPDQDSVVQDKRGDHLVDFQALLAGSPDSAHGWNELTSYLSTPLLDRVFSSSASGARHNTSSWTLSSVSAAAQDASAEHIPGLSSTETSSVLGPHISLNLLPIITKQTWPSGAVGRDRTVHAQDRSWYLMHLMDSISSNRQESARQLLGEVQICFLMVLTLANYSCFEQWKRIFNIIFTCKSALTEIEQFFVLALRMLKSQLMHCEDVEGGLFEFRDEGSAGWLWNLLSTFKGNMNEVYRKEESGSEKLLEEALQDLETFMQETYGWQLSEKGSVLKKGLLDLEDGERVEMDLNDADEDDETGEYAPVVVEM